MTAPTTAGRKKPAMIVDADIHVNDSPEALAPFCAMPWRKSLEQLARTPQRYLDVPGFAPGLRLDPPIPGGHPMRSVHTAAAMRTELDTLGITHGIMIPDNLLLFAMLPNIEYATALGQAYNRWLLSEWVDPAKGLFGAVMAFPQNPQESAKEIRAYADKPGIVAVYLPTAGVNPLWGHRNYDPILAAAEETGLPVILHSVTVMCSSFPCQMEQFENAFARQVLGHPFAMMSNLTSLMHTGVPARYPKLKIVFTEAGIAWVPMMMWRMDRYHQEYRRMVPFLEERPSDYMKRQMWFATQPLEEPDIGAHFAAMVDQVGGAERVLFASDWPHHDFDHPSAMSRLPFTDEQRQRIMWENAVELFNLPRPAEAEVGRP